VGADDDPESLAMFNLYSQTKSSIIIEMAGTDGEDNLDTMIHSIAASMRSFDKDTETIVNFFEEVVSNINDLDEINYGEYNITQENFNLLKEAIDYFGIENSSKHIKETISEDKLTGGGRRRSRKHRKSRKSRKSHRKSHRKNRKSRRI
jgi:hypothetical protein